MKVLIPAAGKSLFFKDNFFPKLLVDIGGVSMIERVMQNLKSIEDPEFIFVFNKEDIEQFHLDRTVRLLADKVESIQIEGENSGAVCSCLLACDRIDEDKPLLILNSDQIIDINYQQVVEYFLQNDYQAGVVTFDAVHPRWSYVNTIGNEPVEFCEKNPISKMALAGFYFFRKGSEFLKSAKKVLLKNNNVNGQFYLSAVLNELILEGKRIGIYSLPNSEAYHSFYSLEKIRLFEKKMGFDFNE
ncbi:glycosyltransferase family 2 protein [Turicimonas muris]|uniref:glycosyltransferase family 2 protein n=1 Tax=Turicimonas muris TaxID=1796652 RepID=UPI0026761CFE|nr:glycosyltransferase family 2 protein [Turicimonas muris]